jgi:hypothetical protein
MVRYTGASAAGCCCRRCRCRLPFFSGQWSNSVPEGFKSIGLGFAVWCLLLKYFWSLCIVQIHQIWVEDCFVLLNFVSAGLGVWLAESGSGYAGDV